MATRSKAYEEGFSSMKYINPYDHNTQEYNDFERGWVQRLKQGYPVTDTWLDNNTLLEPSKYQSTVYNRTAPPKKRRTFRELLINYRWNSNKKK